MVGALIVALLSLQCASAEEAGAVSDNNPIVCQCRCCYLGDCKPLKNATWFVSDCGACNLQLCQNYVTSQSIRRRTATLFEALEDDIPAESDLLDEVNVCEVISVLELVTCPPGKRNCRRSTDLSAECFDRNDWLRKYIVVLFITALFLGVVLGLTKNYLPGMQKYNKMWFNY